MKITLTELAPSLKRNLTSFYWLSGDDAILQEEALSLILNKAQEQGFTEKQHFTLTSQFEDPALWQALHNRSLWQERKILLVHLNAGKLTQKGASNPVQSRDTGCQPQPKTLAYLPRNAQ